MPSADNTDTTGHAVDSTEQLLALELAMATLRRRIHDVNDRLYRELRLRGVSL